MKCSACGSPAIPQGLDPARLLCANCALVLACERLKHLNRLVEQTVEAVLRVRFTLPFDNSPAGLAPTGRTIKGNCEPLGAPPTEAQEH